jgi:hypothetical protein
MNPTQRRRLEMLLKRKQGTTSWEIMFVCRTVCPHRRIFDLKQLGWIIHSEKTGERYLRYRGIPPKGWK